MSETDAYNELSAWTMSHGARDFIHQHVVDTWKAQMADESSKPIGVVFSLAGLYLHVERGFTGRQVQEAHMKMAKSRDPWPRLPLPAFRGEMKPSDVLAATEAAAREKAIHDWTVSTWKAFRASRDAIIEILARCAVVPAPSAASHKKAR
jgi:hypothetical protein